MTDVNARIPEHHLEDLDDEIVITISAILCKPNEANFLIDNKTFTFIANPYYFKLKLPCRVMNIVTQDHLFDESTGTYSIHLKKVDEGGANDSEDEFSDAIDCRKAMCGSATSMEDNAKQFYGFANKYSNVFGKLACSFSDVINLPDPDNTSPEERRKLRLQEEDDKWNDNHYLADTMETNHLDSIFNYKFPSPVKELNEDMEKMLDLCNTVKCLNLSEESKRLAEFQMIDILFSYAYDKRTTEGERTVESGWTINKISSTLSWFEMFDDLKSLLVACYRRSLIYPLYRNWDLAKLIHQDVADILEKGSSQVTQSLLEVKEIFDESENRYILNTIYVNNLCWFSHLMMNDRLRKLSVEMKKIKIKKSEVDCDLPLLELAARLTLEEETNGGSPKDISSIVNKITDLKLDGGMENSSTESTSESADESSSDESSSDDGGEIIQSHERESYRRRFHLQESVELLALQKRCVSNAVPQLSHEGL